jgi:hypothetical protein
MKDDVSLGVFGRTARLSTVGDRLPFVKLSPAPNAKCYAGHHGLRPPPETVPPSASHAHALRRYNKECSSSPQLTAGNSVRKGSSAA